MGSKSLARLCASYAPFVFVASLALLSSFAREGGAQRRPPPRRAVQRNFTPLFEAISGGRIADVRRRLPPRAQIDDVDRASGATPLTWLLTPTAAPTETTRAMLVLLLERGADPNARDAEGHTALEAAVRYPWTEGVRMLLARGGDMHVTVNPGESSLYYALCDAIDDRWPGAAAQRADVARALLEAGLDPRAMSAWAQSQNQTVVDRCLLYNRVDVARLLAERGARARGTVTSHNPRIAAVAAELSETALGPQAAVTQLAPGRAAPVLAAAPSAPVVAAQPTAPVLVPLVVAPVVAAQPTAPVLAAEPSAPVIPADVSRTGRRARY